MSWSQVVRFMVFDALEIEVDSRATQQLKYGPVWNSRKVFRKIQNVVVESYSFLRISIVVVVDSL